MFLPDGFGKPLRSPVKLRALVLHHAVRDITQVTQVFCAKSPFLNRHYIKGGNKTVGIDERDVENLRALVGRRKQNSRDSTAPQKGGNQFTGEHPKMEPVD